MTPWQSHSQRISIHGILIKRFRKPDPTPPQLEEYWEIKSSKEWRVTKHSFIKWISSNKEFRFAGTANVGHFVEWNRNMRTHFKDCDVRNSVCQFEVATTTFTKNARNWWDAHCLKRPNLLVTYDQLLEWIRHELVPDSNPALAYMEWSNLHYRGNIDEYMKQVERLMDYFPIQRDTMIACIARPISPEFAAELRNMDIRLEGNERPQDQGGYPQPLHVTQGEPIELDPITKSVATPVTTPIDVSTHRNTRATNLASMLLPKIHPSRL